MRLSEAARDAVLVPREAGGLSHGLRAALAVRMCRHVGDAPLTAHYESWANRLMHTLGEPLAWFRDRHCRR
ncbi:hypothetical protein GCM10007857_25300 [Bradyrhizobium iriomotense]|uniref:Uncharacterized protein n=1 Tax=Bradyrhizobium iriomotense TaxID=441950 RepID=A0ABQ6AXL9_9BRAD|nr:hypothetical protein GCM10007857_25300 [Bradyrhizobium iriomotense]